MSGVLDGLLSITSPWGYVIVGLLAGLEAAAFVGLVIPGETAMLLGGALTATSHADLPVMMTVASIGAVVGDSLGYEIGRHFGTPLRRSRLGRRVGEARWTRAEEYVRLRGGKAIFLGRFVGVLRALVPAMAGVARMPYRTFLPYNAAGGVVWACGYVFAGNLAGNSYQRVAKVAGRAGLLLAIVAVAFLAFVLAARWVAHHRAQAARPFLRIWNLEPVQKLATRYERQVAFIVNRLRPDGALGLLLSVQLVILVALGAAFSAVLDDVVRREELVSIDTPVANFLVVQREAWLTRMFEIITWAGSATVLVPVLLAAGLYVKRRRHSWRSFVFMAVSLAGASALSSLIKMAVARPRPTGVHLVDAFGYGFPSGHATAAMAGWLSAALVLATRASRWGHKVALVAGALLISGAVGLSRVYLGVHRATDVLGGWTLGAMWVVGVAIAMWVTRNRRQENEKVKKKETVHA